MQREVEAWKPVNGYEGLYEVSDLGRVRRLPGTPGCKNGRILAPRHHNDGYLTVQLFKNNVGRQLKIHRLVLIAFVGTHSEKQTDCNHINGNKQDNRLTNLEWCTRSENMLHAKETGLWNSYGSSNWLSRLSESDVLVIRDMYQKGVLQRDIAQQFGISRENVSLIVNRKTWAHVQE